MATWTTITDSVLEPLKPIRSVDGLALRDNPIAIAEGAAGAPRIAAGALQTGNPERDWVLARTADAGAGVVGTYAFAFIINQQGSDNVGFGTTFAGSGLRPTSAGGTTGTGSLSGTWRCMGDPIADDGPSTTTRTTLWLRIS